MPTSVRLVKFSSKRDASGQVLLQKGDGAKNSECNKANTAGKTEKLVVIQKS